MTDDGPMTTDHINRISVIRHPSAVHRQFPARNGFLRPLVFPSTFDSRRETDMSRVSLIAIAGILLFLWIVGWMMKIAGQVIHGLAVLALLFFVASFFLQSRTPQA